MWEMPPSYYYVSLGNTTMCVTNGSHIDAVLSQAAHLAIAPELLRGGAVTFMADSWGLGFFGLELW
jgi:hypothetical protein